MNNKRTQRKRRILLITRNFPPSKGGMERLLYHVYSALADQNQLYLMFPFGCEKYVAPDIEYDALPLVLPRFLFSCQWRAFRTARKWRPDLIISGSGVTVPAAWIAARSIGVPVLSYLHGLDIVVNSLLYKYLFLPFIRRCDGILVNSAHTARLAENAGVNRDRINIQNPGTSYPVDLGSIDTTPLLSEFSVQNRTIILSVGRLTQRKGLLEFIQNSLPSIAMRSPDILLLVIGSDPVNAIGGKPGMTELIKTMTQRLGLERNVLFVGNTTDVQLAMAYVAAKVLVFPVIDLPGDVEGFGMVALEAAAHGLPTVAFDSGGVLDAVEHGQSGYLVSQGNYEGMVVQIDKIILGKSNITSDSCRAFAEQRTWVKFGEKLRSIVSKYID